MGGFQGAFSSFWAVIAGCLVVEKPDLPPPMATSVFGWWAHVGPKSCLAVPGCPAAGHMAPHRRVHMSQPQPASHLLPPASQNRKSLAFSRYQLHAHCPCPRDGALTHPQAAPLWTIWRGSIPVLTVLRAGRTNVTKGEGCSAPGLGPKWGGGPISSVCLVTSQYALVS